MKKKCLILNKQKPISKDRKIIGKFAMKNGSQDPAMKAALKAAFRYSTPYGSLTILPDRVFPA